MKSIRVLNKWRHRIYNYNEITQGLDYAAGVRGVKKLRGFVFRVSSMADRRKEVGFAFSKGEEHVFLKKNAGTLGFIPDPLSKCGAYTKEV